MKKFIIAMALLALPVAAFADGVDLSWNECAGSALATSNKTFTCTGTTNQNYNLIVQFKSPVDVPNCVAITAVLDVLDETASGGPMPTFWHYEQGSCQQSAAVKGMNLLDDRSLVTIDPDGNGCAQVSDPWGGDGSLGSAYTAVYAPDYSIPGRGRFGLLDFTCSATGTPITAGVNYYAFHLQFNNRNRVACAPGCTDKIAVAAISVTLESEDGSQVVLTGGDKFSQCASINDPDGCQRLLGIGTPPVPDRVAIQNVRPNPSTGFTSVLYGIPHRTHVTLAIFDLNGRRIRSLVDGELQAGVHSAAWNGRNDGGNKVSSGMYFVRLITNGVVDTRGIAIVK